MTSPYLQGNFAPVRDERTIADLPVLGHLPPELEGMFVRNGSNPYFEPLGHYHWFDGDGMLHAVSLAGGRARYVNRYIRTAALAQEQHAGRALWRGLSDSPLQNPDRLYKNVANTSVLWHHRQLLALWEMGTPHAVEPRELTTRGPYDFGGVLDHAFTAHPKVDPVTGELFTFGYSPVRKPYLRYSVFDREGRRTHATDIDLEVCSAMHDMAITERFVLFLDLPFTFRLERVKRGEPLAAWEPERPCRFGVLGKHAAGDTLRWFESSPGYIFHVLNAHEEGDAVVLTAARMDRMDIAAMGAPRGTAERHANSGARLHRWRFDLATGACSEIALDDATIEFPKVADARVGRPARYGYAGRHVRGERVLTLDGVIKYDLERGAQSVCAFPGGGRGGEFVFVPRRGATAEDDGWLVGFVHDGAREASDLVALDARTMDPEPVARVKLPVRIPYGFHGTWVPAGELARG